MIKTFFEKAGTAVSEIFDENGGGRVSTKIELAEAPEMAEVYTEITRIEGQKTNARVVWKLKNTHKRYSLRQNLQLTPVFAYPTMRVNF